MLVRYISLLFYINTKKDAVKITRILRHPQVNLLNYFIATVVLLGLYPN